MSKVRTITVTEPFFTARIDEARKLSESLEAMAEESTNVTMRMALSQASDNAHVLYLVLSNAKEEALGDVGKTEASQ